MDKSAIDMAKWCEENRAKLYQEYPDEWLLVENFKILAHFPDYRELIDFIIGCPAMPNSYAFLASKIAFCKEV